MMKLVMRLAVVLILLCCFLSLLLLIYFTNTKPASIFLIRLLLKRVHYDLDIKRSSSLKTLETSAKMTTPVTLRKVVEMPKVSDNAARVKSYTIDDVISTTTAMFPHPEQIHTHAKHFDDITMEPLLVDTGPGAKGEPVNVTKLSLSVEDQAKFDVLYDKLGYNAFASDRTVINRKGWDPRPQSCKDLRYPTSLPEISVVIPFRDEHLSVLLRTVYSIVGNTPTNLLREVILVDDGSINNDTRDLQSLLDSEIRFLHKVFVLRMDRSVGLMMARQAGVDRSTADYFAIMDSHMEVAEGWVEPLLFRLLQKPKALLCSRMGSINRDTFSVLWRVADRPSVFPYFTWNLEQMWTFYTSDFKASIQNFTEPVPFPTVQGMMIVMKKSWFLALGGFDPGMKLWGTEQFEISVKVWMCGGVVEIVRCSFAAHLYRKIVWTIGEEGLINKLRFAEVWMDEYKKYVYTDLSTYRRDVLSKVNYGNIEERKKIRQHNNCSSFESFMQGVKKIGHIYDPTNALYRGKFCNIRYNMCLFYSDDEQLLTVKKLQSAKRYELSQEQRLHTFLGFESLVPDKDGRLTFQKLGSNEVVMNSKWDYIQNRTMVHRPKGKCLSVHVTLGESVFLEDCRNEDSQFWYWIPYEY